MGHHGRRVHPHMSKGVRSHGPGQREGTVAGGHGCKQGHTSPQGSVIVLRELRNRPVQGVRRRYYKEH